MVARLLLLLMLPTLLFAQSKNTWQELQPGGSNYVARSTGYPYGWPACGSCDEESDVAAQWTFTEGSGLSVTDEVDSLVLTIYKGAAAEITYRVTNTDYSSKVNPGINVYTQSSGQTAGFYTADGTSLALGASVGGVGGDAVIEWVASYDAVQYYGTSLNVVWTGDDGAGQGLNFIYTNVPTTPSVNIWVRATDNTLVQNIAVLTTNPFDGKTHKHRVVIDRSGNSEYFIDKVSQTSASLAALADKTVPSPRYSFMGANVSGVQFNTLSGAVYEWRHSLNATNDSGGPDAN